MLRKHHISVIIPAKDEASAIVHVIRGLRKLDNGDNGALIDDIIVCDNGSRDGTGKLAVASGARVVRQVKSGYGIACQSAMAALSEQTDIVLFVDGDNSCNPKQAHALCQGIIEGADLVIGSRKRGQVEPGAMSFAQRFGNGLACWILSRLYGKPVTDLGPYRAIGKSKLDALAMQDTGFGWTVEMQAKALEEGFRIKEVAVDCRRRIGQSKISGTVAGVIGAGKGILLTIFKVWWQYRRRTNTTPVVLKKREGRV